MKTGTVHIGMRKKRYVFHVALYVVLIFSISGMELLADAQEVDLSMQEISYTTEDNMTIFGSWIVSQDPGKSPKRRPVVILLHDYGLNRRDWGVFIPDLVQRGYNVLAIDLRGHGQSRGQGGSSASSAEYMIKVGHLDVQAALEWIKSRKDADKKRVALIGVGIGADIAYICSGKFKKKLKRAVVISPSYSAITDADFVGSNPRAILFCASADSKRGTTMFAVETLSNFTADPKKVVIYNSSAHGLAMFYTHPELKQEIFDWLSQ
jgi:pimeloyl-ACP methyl ester carboxylesterase